jgi:4-hydroxybenzoate polyprenyltransferase
LGRLRLAVDVDLAAEGRHAEVTKLPRLYLTLLRYRVAAMVILFMLLGAAYDGALELGAAHAFAALTLASSYVAATALNDLADEAIDRVNHPRDAGRPLVEGTATRRELLVLHVAAAGLALLAAVPLGWSGLALIALALVVSQAYSARPLRLSYRTAAVAPALGVAYVLIPFGLGVVASGGDFALSPFTAGLFCLFLARIVLKDFRDREGDALYGKPTMLLRFGKTATCALSLVFLVGGDLLLALSLDLVLSALLQPLLAAIGWMLWTLWRTDEPRGEQVAIGIGARLGNGVLLSVLAWLIVSANGASSIEAATIAGTIAALVLLSSLALAARADDVVIGYKG